MLLCRNTLKVHHIITVILVGLCVTSTGTPHNIIKRTSDTDPLTRPQGYPNCSNEGEIFPRQLQNVTTSCQIWICHNKQWIAQVILSTFGRTKSQPFKSCKDVADAFKKSCKSELYSLQNAAFWVKIQDQCTGEEETMQVYCDILLDGGGWTMVWKHSYLEVTTRNTSMYWYSDFHKPCLDLNGGSDGWCNIPRKIRFHPTEMLIAAYHKKQLVYAFKGDYNWNIDHYWHGVTLQGSTSIVNYCQSGSNVSPLGGNYYGITGLALSHTISSSGRDYRWRGCNLPPCIGSAYHTQMTVVIFVR